MSIKKLACAAAAALVLPAWGQFGGPGGHRPERDGSAGMAERPGGGSNYPLDQLQRQLEEAHAKLKLRADQEAYWEEYAEKVGALMNDQLRSSPRAATEQGQPAPAQIARKVDVVRNRLAAMEDIADAAKRLYAKLDAGQRATADLWLPATVPELYSGLWQAGGPGGPGGRAPSGGPPVGPGARGGPGSSD
ncbi:MAG TPA: hypothetical protein VMB75_10410 [Rhodocyclaceae bacterium]|nr:hypothetical protein [Rhodocyclaceae bacterium]